jgi:hypothetical protein
MLEKALKTIHRLTWIHISVIIVLLITLTIFQKIEISTWGANRINSVIGLLGVAIFSVALPILIRTLEYQRSVKNAGMSVSRFKRMKTLSLYSVDLGTLFALFSWYIPIYRYHMYLAILMGIYGIYSVLPIKGGNKQDIRGFGVIDE